MSRIIGIDQSFVKCAYVVIENWQLIEFGVITSDSNEDSFSRANQITRDIKKVITRVKPDKVHLEGLAFGMKGNATRDLAGLQFCLVCSIRYDSGIQRCDILSPTAVKKAATGSGKADKAAMVAALPVDHREMFEAAGFKKGKGLDDLADAYHIAFF